MGRVVKCVHVSFGFGLLFVSGLLGQQTSPFHGSVPAGARSPQPLALTLDDAIQRGLNFNLGLLEKPDGEPDCQSGQNPGAVFAAPSSHGDVRGDGCRPVVSRQSFGI